VVFEGVLIGVFVVFSSIWLAVNIFHYYSFFRGREKFRETSQLGRELLPKISILVPAYKEEEVIKNTLDNLFGSDYPREKLEIIVLLEADDKETGEIVEILRKTKYPELRSLVVKETAEPKGKPRALNQGLVESSGKIVGVIDAEDIIESKLFQKVAYRFQDKSIDALMGILDIVNEFDGWRCLQFKAEWGYWFRRYLPSFKKIGYPLPLGGSTCFFRKRVLEEMGGWDSYNLTEDFDLGLRLYSEGKRIELFDAVTKEEAPRTFWGWLKQRTRWQRGKLQTLRKIIKNPPSSFRKRILMNFLCISSYIELINLTGVGFGIYLLCSGFLLPFWVWVFACINLAAILGYMTFQGEGYFQASDETRWKKIGKAIICAITLPFYWFCQWLADLRAMKQEYITKKIVWEKTNHEGRHFKTKEERRIRK
jgi:cellulose synthase/poly-beta-1,6-N-acetylglucosamine synthase-like glycosyltransferase